MRERVCACACACLCDVRVSVHAREREKARKIYRGEREREIGRKTLKRIDRP